MKKQFAAFNRIFFLLILPLFLLLHGRLALAQTGNNASFLNQVVPATMVAGQAYSVTLGFNNTGSTDWTTAASYVLGSSNPRDNLTWGLGRVALPATVARGTQGYFTFNVTAPKTPGTYNMQWQMLREGVEWFGAVSPNVAVSVVAPQNGAQFISQTVPSTMSAGQSYTVWVTMKNIGNTTWPTGTVYGLGSQNPENNTVWAGNRSYLPSVVPPGQQVTFSMNVTAPTTVGTYPFQWRMVQEFVEWFGDYTPATSIAVTTPQPAPTITVQRNPSPLVSGQAFTTSWSTTNASSVSRSCTSSGSGFTDNSTLATSGSVTATASAAWVGYPTTCTWTASGAGGSKTFVETVTTVSVTNGAQFVAQNVPTSMTAGKTYNVSVTMLNTGTSTWTAASYHGLGSQSPQDNFTWMQSANRVPVTGSVAPGQQAVFNFTVTAPSSNGTYNFQWQMVQDFVTWFGPFSPNVPVTVTGGTSEGTITYFHNDLSGTPIAATDANGALLWKQNYMPFGEMLSPSQATTNNNIGFAGKPFDQNTGLSYMGARYYDPSVGRFFGIDPDGFKPENLHSFNRYAYANNNPYKFVDPDGHSPVDVVFLVYDLGKLGFAVYSGVGIAAAGIDAGLDVIGVVSPMFGTGQVLKASRAAERGVELTIFARGSGRAAETTRTGERLSEGARKLPNERLKAPPSKRGNAPIGDDGHPVELHHVGQKGDSQIAEMTRTDHRLGDNFKKNHTNTGNAESDIDRKMFNQDRKDYWKDEWDSGRFHFFR